MHRPWHQIKDPALSIIKFMACGNIFYPIPASPVPILKPFKIWGVPWFFPSGLVFKYARK